MSLILKQETASSVPTPPAGKGTIFLSDSDTLTVKLANGTSQGFPTIGGSNTQVIFNDNGALNGDADFTFNKTNNTLTIANLTVSGTLIAGDIAVSSIANGTSNIDIVGVSGNVTTSVAGNANVQVITGTGVNVAGTLNATGNITGNYFIGNGSQLTDITATTAATVTTAAQPNITSVGTLTSLAVGATSSNVDFPNAKSISSQDNSGVTASDNIGTVAEAVANSTNTAITGIGVLGIGRVVSATKATGVQGEGHVTNTGDTGAAVGIRGYATDTHSAGYNIGVLGNAMGSGTGNYAFYVQNGGIASIENDTFWDLSDNSNISITFNSTGKANIFRIDTTDSAEGIATSGYLTVAGNANVTGNATVGGVKTDNYYYANGSPVDFQQAGGSNTQIQFNDGDQFGGSANFTFDKATQQLLLNGNATFTNANLGNLGTANYLAGTLTTASQPNITTVGTLSSLTVTNKVTAGQLQGDGGNISNIQGANVSGTVSSATTAGTVTTAAQPNITSVGTLSSLAVTGNVTSGNVYANSGTIGASLLTGTLTTAAQPNVTSVGTLSSLTVTGNIVSGNIDGGNLVKGNYVQGTLTTAAQPNITSVGTLTSLDVTGNANAGNVGATTFVGNLNGTGNSNVGNIGGGAGVFTANVTAGNVYANSGTIGASLLTGTLTTAAQPNITSVGTLSSLVVSGNSQANGNIITDNILGRTGAVTITAAGTNTNINLVPNGTGTVDVASKRITSLAEPNASTDAATKNYVDSIAQGLHVHAPCAAATPDTLANVTSGTVTYNNGSSGVGANLTTTGSFNLIDGVNVQTSGTRILVKNEANAAWNGIYTWSNATVITRATDFDTPTEMAGGDFTFVTAGTLYNDTGWVLTDPVTTVGTTSATFVQFSGAGTYTAGTGLTLSGTQFSITNTAVTPASYGNGDRVASFTVNGQGQLTAASDVVITANAGNLTGTTLAATVVNSSLTSVGTLTGLGVNGTITGVNITANTGVFTGNANGLSSLQGTNVVGTLNSTTLGNSTLYVGTTAIALNRSSASQSLTGITSIDGYASTVSTAAQPNITSVGTLTSLSVTGTTTSGNFATAGNITASFLVSNVATGTAPLTVTSTTRVANLNVAYANVADNINVTAPGTGTGYLVFANATTGNVAEWTSSTISANLANSAITATTFVGTLSGAATTAGTVTTAAQPNITSVGTLTSLGSSGNITAPNFIANTGFFISSVGTALSAAGTTQGDATALTKEVNVVSTVATGAGVKLPTAVAGMRVTIMNTAANALLVYPDTNGIINSAAANASFSLGAAGRLDFVAVSTTQWYTLSATYS